MAPGVAFALAAAGTYLLAAVPFGFVIAKLHGIDLRRSGSGNIGATNAARALGTGWFFPIFALDFLKGFAPVFWMAPILAEAYPLEGVAWMTALLMSLLGFAAIAGHLYPIWLNFKGGKGAATGVGVVFGLNPIAGAGALGVFVLVLVATRFVSLGSIFGAFASPLLHLLHGGRFAVDPYQKHVITAFLALVSLFVIVRHRQNIARILRGEERRIGAPPRQNA